jgi:hypothetical protein
VPGPDIRLGINGRAIRVPSGVTVAAAMAVANDTVCRRSVTSGDGIWCAGEATGIGGVDLSSVEGVIAGCHAAGDERAARRLFGERTKARRFADAVNRAFALRPELRNLPRDDTIVCRCEDVVFGRVRTARSFREAKLHTRCGMGTCQGRICGAAADTARAHRNAPGYVYSSEALKKNCEPSELMPRIQN